MQALEMEPKGQAPYDLVSVPGLSGWAILVMLASTARRAGVIAKPRFQFSSADGERCLLLVQNEVENRPLPTQFRAFSAQQVRKRPASGQHLVWRMKTTEHTARSNVCPDRFGCYGSWSPDLHNTARLPGPQLRYRPHEIVQDTSKPAPGRIFVVGRVLDAQGNPVPNASVLVYARATAYHDGPEVRAYPKEIGRSTSDGAGRIRVDVPRTSLSSQDEFGVVALAPGFGAGWLSLDADAEQPGADITLPPEQIIHGRVFDLFGQPVGNAKISVTAIRRVIPSATNPRRGFEGPAFWWDHSDDLPGCPRTTVSEADGRFTVRGVGQGFRAFLTVVDPRFATQVVEIDTDENSLQKPLAVALQPARTISGRVTFADTGMTVPNVRVAVTGFDQFRQGLGGAPILTTTQRPASGGQAVPQRIHGQSQRNTRPGHLPDPEIRNGELNGGSMD